MFHLLIPAAIGAKVLVGHFVAAHAASTATALGSHGIAAAGPHTLTLAAGKAGAVAGKALAAHAATSAGAAGTHAGAAYLLPVHVLPYHAVVDAGITTAAVGGATSAALSPTVTHAMTKFVQKFATGYGIARLKRECGGHLDLGTVRRWFRAQPESDLIPVTATGTVRDGRFWPGECPSEGPFTLLQGYFNPRTATLPKARLLCDVDEVSAPVRKNHRGSGLAFYLSGSAVRPAA